MQNAEVLRATSKGAGKVSLYVSTPGLKMSVPLHLKGKDLSLVVFSLFSIASFICQDLSSWHLYLLLAPSLVFFCF